MEVLWKNFHTAQIWLYLFTAASFSLHCFFRLRKHLCSSFIQKRTALFFCADCSLVTSDHSTMSCHTDQWPIKQGTRKGRTYAWQTADKQWTSFQFFTEHLSTTCVTISMRIQPNTQTFCSRTNVPFDCKIKALPSLNVKDHLNWGNNGALALSAVRGCDATELC